MNALFVTQGLNVRFFHALADALAPALPLSARGFYVCNSLFHETYRDERPDFASEPHVVSEWAILRAAEGAAHDAGYLAERERAYGQGPLWDALVCDRRMMQGRWCKERQDYKPRFSHEQYLRILTAGIRRLEALFDELRPHVILGLVPVTFGEYLIWMIAKERGIPTLFLYPTKIQNYMCWMDSFFGQPDVLTAPYAQYRAGLRDEWFDRGLEYVKNVSSGPVRHEGMVAIPGVIDAPAKSRESLAARVARLASAEWRYRRGPARHDNHVTPPIETLIRQDIVLKSRRRRVTAALRDRYVTAPELGTAPYAFYPLHAEPEVALSIQGKPYLNQIETMRQIARSLPAGMQLFTKEHPRSIGYHPVSYYDKLLEIPNVRIVDPFVESREVVASAAFVATVWSFVGFEAILQRRPVLSFGTPPFAMLPASMIRPANGFKDLHKEIAAMQADYAYDEPAVAAYVAACMKASFPLDFYATYLEKKGRFVTGGADSRQDTGLAGFIGYTTQRIGAACARSC